jgi:hypothetical protein
LSPYVVILAPSLAPVRRKSWRWRRWRRDFFICGLVLAQENGEQSVFAMATWSKNDGCAYWTKKKIPSKVSYLWLCTVATHGHISSKQIEDDKLQGTAQTWAEARQRIWPSTLRCEHGSLPPATVPRQCGVCLDETGPARFRRRKKTTGNSTPWGLVRFRRIALGIVPANQSLYKLEKESGQESFRPTNPTETNKTWAVSPSEHGRRRDRQLERIEHQHELAVMASALTKATCVLVAGPRTQVGSGLPVCRATCVMCWLLIPAAVPFDTFQCIHGESVSFPFPVCVTDSGWLWVGEWYAPAPQGRYTAHDFQPVQCRFNPKT